MCRMASAFINPRTLQVRVADLDSHANTAKRLGITDGTKPDDWREMHYTPGGEIECRCLAVDSHTSAECVESVRKRWPTLALFFSLAVPQCSVMPKTLYLSGLQSAEGLVLPAGVKTLYLAAAARKALAAKGDGHA